MAVKVRLQTLREGTEYQSYRITLPKDIVEAKGWGKTQFTLELTDNSMILKPVKKK